MGQPGNKRSTKEETKIKEVQKEETKKYMETN